jgi:molybdopterin-guanine dinucleotide biosynthesis protein MobB
MSVPIIFGVYGESDTGKTTLITQLVSYFTKKGYRIATIKQTKKTISIDTPNKDTWRHHDAGADLVIFSSLLETDFLFHQTMKFPEIIRRIGDFGWYDLVFIEGASDATIPKIQIGSGKKRRNTITSYTGDIKEIISIITGRLKTKPSLSQLQITVNGKKIPLSEFPEQIISNTILGLVGSLKGVRDIHEVSIHMKR